MHTFLIRVVKIRLWNDVVIGDHKERSMLWPGRIKQKGRQLPSFSY
jgi:hypothetical protein